MESEFASKLLKFELVLFPASVLNKAKRGKAADRKVGSTKTSEGIQRGLNNGHSGHCNFPFFLH